MKAGFKDFFGTNLEQEVIDEVVILPYLTENYRRNFAKDISSIDFTEFESVMIFLSAFSGDFVHESFTIDSVTLKKPEWGVSSVVSNSTGSSRTNVSVSKTSSTLTVSCVDQVGALPESGVKYMIGYKRRISRVGIDELMSAMSLPNLIANADLTDNPINQRGFDGNWTALAVGDYGYDQWMKVSATHMGYAVEAGKYRPSTKHTLTKDDVVIGEFMSPASGHWSVAIPFATSGKFDLYAGQFKRPWHPVLDGEFRCLSSYEIGETTTLSNSTDTASSHYLKVSFSALKRKTPNVTRINQGMITSNTDGSLVSAIKKDGFYFTKNASDPQVTALGGAWIADASITLAELNGQIITVG